MGEFLDRAKLTCFRIHVQCKPRHRLNLKRPDQARNHNEQRRFRDMHTGTQTSPEAVVEMIAFQMVGRECRRRCVLAVVCETFRGEYFGVRVAFWVFA